MIKSIDPSIFQRLEQIKPESQGQNCACRTDEKTSSDATLLGMSMRSERVEISATSQDAFLKGYRESMHVDAKIRMGDSVWDISVDVQREVIMQGAVKSPQEFQKGLLDSLPEDVRKKIEGYLAEGGFPEALSPENVSNNIVNFALMGFNGTQGDDADARQTYLDYIIPAIDKGFKEALDMLEAFLTPEARDVVSETRRLVGEKLEAWKGLDITA